MEFIFLGTSCMVPTKDRNHAGLIFKNKSEMILFDCGEGTQRQLKSVDISIMKINRIFISHWHGDHTLGLPGLLQTMAAGQYEGVLKIYGPKDTEKRINKMFEAFIFDNKINLEIIEIKDNDIIKLSDIKIKCYKLDHGIETYGFRITEDDKRRIKQDYINKMNIPQGPLLGKLALGKDIEYNDKKIKAKDATYIVKGRIIGIINDTIICSNCNEIAKDADLLISESVYTSKHEDKAIEYKHMTAKQAAQVSSANNVKKLILFHYSQRYKTTNEILEDAKDVFENTIAAFDFMKVKI